MILISWLRSGRSGRAWRMIRDHEIAASAMGIPVARYKLMLFTITSAIIGVQGGLTAHFTGAEALRDLPGLRDRNRVRAGTAGTPASGPCAMRAGPESIR